MRRAVPHQGPGGPATVSELEDLYHTLAMVDLTIAMTAPVVRVAQDIAARWHAEDAARERAASWHAGAAA